MGAHPETRGCGGSYSKKLGELSLVGYESTRREEHTNIFLIYMFESLNFCPKISLFSALMSISHHWGR